MFPKGPMFHYLGQNASDVNMPPVAYNQDETIGQPMQINGLDSVLANAAPEMRKMVCIYLLCFQIVIKCTEI